MVPACHVWSQIGLSIKPGIGAFGDNPHISDYAYKYDLISDYASVLI